MARPKMQLVNTPFIQELPFTSAVRSRAHSVLQARDLKPDFGPELCTPAPGGGSVFPPVSPNCRKACAAYEVPDLGCEYMCQTLFG